MQISKVIETETGHRLTDYPHKCAHLHGHRYVWEVTVSSVKLDKTGFVIDFGDLKHILKDTIGQLDHAFIFHDKDPIIKGMGEEAARELLKATNGQRGRITITPFNPTSENLVNWMAEILKESLPGHVHLYKIKMWETSGSFTEWRNSVKLRENNG